MCFFFYNIDLLNLGEEKKNEKNIDPNMLMLFLGMILLGLKPKKKTREYFSKSPWALP